MLLFCFVFVLSCINVHYFEELLENVLLLAGPIYVPSMAFFKTGLGVQKTIAYCFSKPEINTNRSGQTEGLFQLLRRCTITTCLSLRSNPVHSDFVIHRKQSMGQISDLKILMTSGYASGRNMTTST